MSLDIHQLTAHLSRERRIEVLRAYRLQAKHDTTAFLFCFFLGTIGAHRLYLRQWGAAVPRLALGALFLIGLAVGIIAQVPVSVLAVVLAVLFIIMLAWEISDLFGIDAEVDEANRALAQRLLATQPSADTARPTAQAATAPAGLGTITASDIAGALALADEVGTGRLREPTSTPGGPDTSPALAASAMGAMHPPSDLTDTHPWPGSTHPIADPEATQGPVYVELSATPTPDAPPAVVASPLVASGGPDHTDAHAPQAHPIADVEATGAALTEAAAVYVALPHQAPTTPPTPSAPVDATDQHTQVQRTHPIADVEGVARGPVVVDLPAGASALAITNGADLTDAHPHVPQARQVGDIEAGGRRGSVYVNLPDGQAPSGDDALVMFVPSEEVSPPATPTPGASPWGGMAPPDAPAAERAPVWPVAPAEPAAPPVWPVAPTEQPNVESERQPETLAELATLGGAAGIAGAAEHATRMHDAPPGVASEPTLPLPPRDTPAVPSVPPVTPEPAAPPIPTATPMKRVRVVRRIVLEDGGVVRELVAERIVPMDTDSQAVAAELEAELAHATPEEIAELAHLPSDTPIVVRSRVESGPLSGKLKPPDEQTPPAQGGN